MFMNYINENPNAAMTDGMHLLVDALKFNGVETIYGVVGVPITDMARYARRAGIRYIGFRHEQLAGHAAAISGYLTRKPGICLTVSVSGFLNGLEALAEATVNGFPMIQIGGLGDCSVNDWQQDDYEEFDPVSIAKPFVKAAFRINRPQDIAVGIARAIRAALSGRPGGVYLDITKTMLKTTMDIQEAKSSLFMPVDPAPVQMPCSTAVKRALKLLSNATKPLVIIGKGAAYSQVEEQLKDFIEKTGIPFLTMEMAKGILPDDHPQCAASARSLVLGQADVVMLVGVRLGWLQNHGKDKKWNPNVKFIQLDVCAEEMDSICPIDAPVVGSISSSLDLLLCKMEPFNIRCGDAWMNSINAVKKVDAEKMQEKLNTPSSSLNYFNALKVVGDVLQDYKEIYLVSESTNALDNTRNVINMYHPRLWLDTGTRGAMGVGMGYSIGAAVTSGRQVLVIGGDSAFGFSGMEIETICRYRLPITILVLDNGGIYQGDEKGQGQNEDPFATMLMPDDRYERLIEAFGGRSYHVTTADELDDALDSALASKWPSLIRASYNSDIGV